MEIKNSSKCTLFIYPPLTNGLTELTALTENQISKTEAIYAVMHSVPLHGLPMKGFNFSFIKILVFYLLISRH
jgi:hypothetical protein